MKLTSKEFENFIISEVKKIAQKEGWLLEENKNFVVKLKHDNGTVKIKTSASDKETAEENVMKAEKCPRSAIISTTETVNEETLKIGQEDTKEVISEKFETVEPAKEEPATSVHDIKKLNEEFKRMKQLVDFRSPLLIKD